MEIDRPSLIIVKYSGLSGLGRSLAARVPPLTHLSTKITHMQYGGHTVVSSVVFQIVTPTTADTSLLSGLLEVLVTIITIIVACGFRSVLADYVWCVWRHINIWFWQSFNFPIICNCWQSVRTGFWRLHVTVSENPVTDCRTRYWWTGSFFFDKF